MDAFIAWARNVSYDIVGIFLPGLFFLTGIFLFIYPHFKLEDLELTKTYVALDNDFLSVIINIIFVFFIYLLGVLLKAINEYSLFKRIYSCKWYGFSKEKILVSYPKYLKPIYIIAKDKLFKKIKIKDQEDDWLIFYKLARSILLKNDRATNIITYQNRYEMHRSISTASFVLCVIIISTSICQWLFCSSYSFNYVCLFPYLLIFDLSRRTFFKYWIIFGEFVIVDLINELETYE